MHLTHNAPLVPFASGPSVKPSSPICCEVGEAAVGRVGSGRRGDVSLVIKLS